MTALDAKRFPTAAPYLERLPRGVDSYVECEVKASILRDLIESRPLGEADLAALPPAVARLVRELPPVSAWVPEVHALIAMLAVRDRSFAAGERGLLDYEQWTYERNIHLLGRPLYRALFLFLSPDRLLRGAQVRWSMFRRGSSVELVERKEGLIRLETSHPPFLHEATMARGMAGALRAAVELAGGRDATVEVLEVRERGSLYEIRYGR